ncbi:PCYOX-like protein [Mya arenaria]|uniref:PCYOX-like protein n=1 Tax=Mya arenaria TaxID=6604 RepID=A0ABY7DVS4_MYAAR|nr:PCYOX-like protein [Mya arenaria]
MPSKKLLYLIYIYFIIASISKATDELEEIARVGIIGAGIGGTSAAYFLRDLFGDKVLIDIFEKQHVGGRLAPVTIGGHNYNAGGTIIHPANLYMLNFTDILGLECDAHPEPGRLGIWNGEEVMFSTSDYLPVTLAKMFWRYGMDAYNIKNWVQENTLACMTKYTLHDVFVKVTL